MSTNRTVTAQTDIPQFQNVADTTYFSHTHIESINTIVSYDSSSSFNNYCTDPAEFYGPLDGYLANRYYASKFDAHKYGIFRQINGEKILVVIDTLNYCSKNGPNIIPVYSLVSSIKSPISYQDRRNFAPVTKLGALSAKNAGELPENFKGKYFICTNIEDSTKLEFLTWDILDFDPVQLKLL